MQSREDNDVLTGMLQDVFIRCITYRDMHHRLSYQSLVSAVQTIQTVTFPGTSQNVNSQRPGAVLCMLHFPLQCPEHSSCSEKINCGCSVNKGGLSKKCAQR